MNRNIIILSIILTLVTVARAVAGAPFNHKITNYEGMT